MPFDSIHEGRNAADDVASTGTLRGGCRGVHRTMWWMADGVDKRHPRRGGQVCQAPPPPGRTRQPRRRRLTEARRWPPGLLAARHSHPLSAARPPAPAPHPPRVHSAPAPHHTSLSSSSTPPRTSASSHHRRCPYAGPPPPPPPPRSPRSTSEARTSRGQVVVLPFLVRRREWQVVERRRKDVIYVHRLSRDAGDDDVASLPRARQRD